MKRTFFWRRSPRLLSTAQIKSTKQRPVEFVGLKMFSDKTIVWWGAKTNNLLPALKAVSACFFLSPLAGLLQLCVAMMAQIKGLNAHDRPPEAVRQCFKKYSKIELSDVDHDPDILDLREVDPDCLPASITLSQYMSSQKLRMAFDDFMQGSHTYRMRDAPFGEDIPVFTHNAISGQLR